MNRSKPLAVVAVLVTLALVLLAACGVVRKPDARAWDDQAARALTDAASQVATARLALESADEGQVWPSYATVLVAEAEEAAGTAEDDLARLQVPPERRDAAVAVLALLGRAVDLVGEARAHVVDEEYDDRALLEDLDTLADELRRAAP